MRAAAAAPRAPTTEVVREKSVVAESRRRRRFGNGHARGWGPFVVLMSQLPQQKRCVAVVARKHTDGKKTTV